MDRNTHGSAGYARAFSIRFNARRIFEALARIILLILSRLPSPSIRFNERLMLAALARITLITSASLRFIVADLRFAILASVSGRCTEEYPTVRRVCFPRFGDRVLLRREITCRDVSSRLV
jgi:hypothetical protein